MTFYKPKHLLFILPVLLIVGAFAYKGISRSIEESEYAMSKKEPIALEPQEVNPFSQPHVVFNGRVVNVEIADDALEWWTGLSDHTELKENTGMLFVFPDKQARTFVMRNMDFPLDIIFIEDNRIVKIYHDLAPEGDNPVYKYSSIVPANYVLEVNAGYADELGMKEGDLLEFSL